MSDRTIPFQLRPNKHIDRRIFIEALKRLSHVKNVSRFGYVTLGGAFLEDCRSLYLEFGMDQLLSTEKDPDEFARQAFNKPFPFIVCRDVAMSALIADFEANLDLIGSPENVVCWLDYQDRDRGGQLGDIRSMMTKLGAFDILRVTMNAALGAVTNEEREPKDGRGERRSLEEALLERSRVELGPYYPEDAKHGEFVAEHFPKVLSRAIYSAARDGLQSGLAVVPVTNLVYRDGQPMLTVTVMICEAGSEAVLIDRAALEDWEFYSRTTTQLHWIEVPTLSVRERTEIDRFLEVGSTAGVSVEVRQVFEDDDLEHYRRFRRYYPTYARIAV